MYLVETEEDVVRIPPTMLSEDYQSTVEKIARAQYEGYVNSRGDIRVLINDVYPVGDGNIVHGDGAVYQKVKFTSISFRLELNEIVEGIVIAVEKYGAFVNIGPLQALLHISQIMDDQLEVDIGNKRIFGKVTKKELKEDVKITVRVVMITINNQNVYDSRIGVTMRQPGLGKKEWFLDDTTKKNKKTEGV